MKSFAQEDDGTMGFQIAPMVDVVFVIMLFFMVMAGAVKVENELSTKLPGSAEASPSAEFNDETQIGISDEGEVSLNDEPFDTPESTELPQLRATAKYSRTIDVLNALAAAKITNVTFNVNEE